MIKVSKIVTSILPADSLYSLLGLHALMKLATSLEMLTCQGTEGGLWIGTFGPQSNSP